MTEIAIGTQPRALSARQGGAGTREDLGLNKEKKGGIILRRRVGMGVQRANGGDEVAPPLSHPFRVKGRKEGWRREIILSRLKSMATGSDL